MAVAAMGAFGAGGLAAVLTERVARYSRTAGSIGVPDHARIMRFAQGWFLAIFVGGPAVTASMLGMSPLISLALLATAAAVGIAVAMWGGLLLIPVALANQVTPLRHWIALPVVQALAAIASSVMIWKWFQLPLRAERAGGFMPLILADARHERTQKPREAANSAPATQQGAEAPAMQMPAAHAVEDLGLGRNFPVILGLGLGYSVTTGWRRLPHGVAIALLVMGAPLAGAAFDKNSRYTQYLSGSARRHLRVDDLLWRRGASWMGRQDLCARGRRCLAGIAFAVSGAACAVLAHRRVREWHLSTLALVLLVGAGGLAILFGVVLAGNSPSGNALVYGAALMVVPPVLALSWYALAPLRLPINTDPRAVQRPLKWI